MVATERVKKKFRIAGYVWLWSGFPLHCLRVLAMWCVPQNGNEASASFARAESG